MLFDACLLSLSKSAHSSLNDSGKYKRYVMHCIYAYWLEYFNLNCTCVVIQYMFTSRTNKVYNVIVFSIWPTARKHIIYPKSVGVTILSEYGCTDICIDHSGLYYAPKRQAYWIIDLYRNTYNAQHSIPFFLSHFCWLWRGGDLIA